MPAYALDSRVVQQIILLHSCGSGRTCRDQANVISSRPSHRSADRPLGAREARLCSTSSRHEAISGFPIGPQQAARPVEGLLVVPRWKPVPCAASSIADQLMVPLRRRILCGCPTRRLRLVHHKADAKSFKLTGVWIEAHGLLPWVGTRTSVAMAEVLIWLPAADRPSSASLVLPL